MRSLTIRQLSLVIAVTLVATVLAIGAGFLLLRGAQGDVTRAYQTRYNSYLLADELRQSSDDLTRLARTYVVSGEDKYEAQYWDVLAIRNGEKPRPQAYSRIYWDFMAADPATKPRADGQKVPLADLMRGAGFTDAEFAKLKQAQANSDGLVKLETDAMNAMKGRFADGMGGYTKEGPPDAAMAQRLMHSPDYHRYKAEIMRPIDDFFVLLDRRTQDAVDAAEARMALYGLVMGLGGALMALAVAATVWLLRGRVVLPIEGLRDVLARLSTGNRTVAITHADRVDEVGDMARAAIIFQKSLGEAEELRRHQVEQDRRALTDRREARQRLAGEFERAVAEKISAVAGAVETLRHHASGLLDSAGDTAHRSDTVSSAALTATSNVQTVAAAAEELSASVGEIARQVTGASRVADQAVMEASTTRSGVQGLTDAARRIGDVVKLINDIAEQTNLLALNATIEAARAGEAGKGFAVVASEVKLLATQTGKATEDIQGQIQSIQQEATRAVAAIAGISRTIGEISEMTLTAAAAVEQQEASAAEITRNVQEAAGGTREVSRNIEAVSITATSTKDAADGLLRAAEGLGDLARALRGDVDGFLAHLRAG